MTLDWRLLVNPWAAELFASIFRILKLKLQTQFPANDEKYIYLSKSRHIQYWMICATANANCCLRVGLFFWGIIKSVFDNVRVGVFSKASNKNYFNKCINIYIDLKLVWNRIFTGVAAHESTCIIFHPITAAAAYIQVFIFISTLIEYHILNMLKIKYDINQQDLKRVDLHFVKSE